MKRIELTGLRFGRWIVLSYEGGRSRHWLCRCDCGTERAVSSLSLRDGRSTSCGCRRIDHKRANLIGQRFSFLTVIAFAGTRPSTSSGNRTYWRVRCDCGTEKDVIGASLVYGSTKSCGRCAAITHGEASRKHETTEYRSWSAMLSRCQNPRSDSWKDYGARGIAVCARWQSYENFIADMGRKPTPAHSIDRKDVNGNYEPENCRWATKKEQTANRRPYKTGRIESFSVSDLLAELQRRGVTVPPA